MQRQLLPRQVDARKLTSTDVQISGFAPVSEFPRFIVGLYDDAGEVDIEMHFFRDEAWLHRISASLATQVSVLCQRCLKSMTLSINSSFELGIVWTEEQAKALPRGLDSMILGEEVLDLLPLVEDELIIGTPYANYHPVGECRPAGPVEYGETNRGEVKRENPFAALKDLKPSD
ncbi:MAG: hypothetical protein ACI89D_000149 [Bermanella sp.]|jgi:uncharacterized protein